MFRFRTFTLDDAFLLLALLAMVGSAAVMERMAAANMLDNETGSPSGLQYQFPGPSYQLLYNQLIQAGTTLEWISLFAARFSLLLFFKKLVARVRVLEIWWWIILVIEVPLACVCSFFTFYICPHLTLNEMSSCMDVSVWPRAIVYVQVTTPLDVLSDLLSTYLSLGLDDEQHGSF